MFNLKRFLVSRYGVILINVLWAAVSIFLVILLIKYPAANVVINIFGGVIIGAFSVSGVLIEYKILRKWEYTLEREQWDFIFNKAIGAFKAAPAEKRFLEGRFTPEELDTYLNIRPKGCVHLKERWSPIEMPPASFVRGDGTFEVTNPGWSNEDRVKNYARAFGVKIRIVKN